MCICEVFYVCKVEKVGIVAELPFRLVVLGDLDEARDELAVAWAKDTGGTDSGGQDAFGAVECESNRLCFCLSIRTYQLSFPQGN